MPRYNFLKPFKAYAAEVEETLRTSLAKDDELTFSQTVINVALNPIEAHNSHSDPVYYNTLINALLDSVQEPTVKNVTFAAILRYLEKIEWAGFGPVFRFNSALPSSEMIAIEPVFNVYCQDDEVLPYSRLVARFSVSANGESFSTVVLDSSWLAHGDVTPSPSLQKPTHNSSPNKSESSNKSNKKKVQKVLA